MRKWHVQLKGQKTTLRPLARIDVPRFLQFGFASLAYVKAGKLRALAVTSAARLPALPDIPTADEFVSNYEATAWYGIGAPKNAPTEIVEKLNKETNAGLADPRIKERLANLGGVAMSLTPTEFGKLIADDTEKWGKVIREANIKVD
jgi:tripartite-type tricarboxylate transporter receptor subunit TctC